MRCSLFFCSVCASSITIAQQPPTVNIIPQPVSTTIGSGSFVPSSATTITFDTTALKDEAAFLGDALHATTDLHMRSSLGNPSDKNIIRLSLQKGTNGIPEGYTLLISAGRIDIIGTDQAGVFHGIGSLLQLARMEQQGSTSFPCLTITDHPRFPWRGMHLDVSRHFFPVEFVKRYIDLMARYKMNVFHWHLTDDQGWRIEIKKYPKLTKVGAWRSGSEFGPYSDRSFDSTRYGGFYTQDQIRDVIEYATARHVTIVPEIEMPGHSLAALAAYPELSCTGGPFEVVKGWGVFDDVFCPKDSTFTFLENVLTEVMDLFPGEYIHIGGDECSKTRWKTCADCQALMKKEGLKDEGELQSYFVQRIEKFVNSKRLRPDLSGGRKIIGWDEILEGGLAPNAAVMSWRGTEGGVAAAKQKHNVVMTPGTHCYFDHYQGDPAVEPLAIGGYTTLQKVYGYEPVPEELDSAEAQYILGAQGNVWTEYITTPEQAEYMALPRMIALAEVLWSPKASRNETDFVRRLESEFANLDAMGMHYSKSLYNVGYSMRGSKKRGQLNVDLTRTPGLGDIRFTVDGSEPCDTSKQYFSTIEQRGNATIKAAMFSGVKKMGNTTALKLDFDLGTGRVITTDPPPSEKYNTGGPFTLIDGVSAQARRVSTQWLGWTSPQVTITVDIGSEQSLTHIGIGALEERYSWIHPPSEVNIATSSDGKTFSDIETVRPPTDAHGRIEYGSDKAASARYVRFIVKSHGKIEDGFAGAGNMPWTFLDEIHIR